MTQQCCKTEEIKDRQIFDLEIVSPVHIGSREGKLSALEFLVDGGKTYIIDEDRFGQLLLSKGLIDLFIEEVGQGPFRTKRFLVDKAKLKPKDSIHSISSYSVMGGADGMQDFRPFTRDGNGEVYLPGTAIKGALRTALIYSFLKGHDKQKNAIEQAAKRDLFKLQQPKGKERAKKSYSAGWLQEALLQNFALPNAKKGPNQDILRCLIVRDAYPVSKIQTQVIKLQFLSKKSDGSFYFSTKKKGGRETGIALELWIEAVTSGTFRTEIIWDKSLYGKFNDASSERFPAAGVDGIISNAFAINNDVITHEKSFYVSNKPGNSVSENAAKQLLQWYEKRKDNSFRIGFGSGMLGTTVNLLFPNDLRQKIRNACGHDRGNDPAPKSRRVWKNAKEEWMPLGWIRVCAPSEPMESATSSIPGPDLCDADVHRSSDGGSGEMGEEEDSARVPTKLSTDLWPHATLNWTKHNDILTASFSEKTAIGKGRELLSDDLKARLSKAKKPLTAPVTVEIDGNKMTILKVEG